jgi:hypothetical protein
MLKKTKLKTKSFLVAKTHHLSLFFIPKRAILLMLRDANLFNC